MQVQQKKRRMMADINLVPLIDVSLILVIIFMVLTPMMVQTQLLVKLPKAKSAVPASSQTTIHVQIEKNGALVIEGVPVRWEDLERELTLKLGRSQEKTLLVQADRTVPIEKVVAVLDAAKSLGVGKLGIGVVSQ